ncbi:hypothetical protein ACI2K4_27320 [Micromonospora sp. NPDC050397]|uniref:hypothetical protein n=1 Tax=Micromonospora sp. NPDC050397 TaxID=3364279 RepID=UPI00385154D1
MGEAAERNRERAVGRKPSGLAIKLVEGIRMGRCQIARQAVPVVDERNRLCDLGVGVYSRIVLLLSKRRAQVLERPLVALRALLIECPHERTARIKGIDPTPDRLQARYVDVSSHLLRSDVRSSDPFDHRSKLHELSGSQLVDHGPREFLVLLDELLAVLLQQLLGQNSVLAQLPEILSPLAQDLVLLRVAFEGNIPDHLRVDRLGAPTAFAFRIRATHASSDSPVEIVL